MVQKRKESGGAGQLAAAVGVGTLLAAAAELAVLAVTSALVTAGRLEEDALLRGCWIGLFLGCFAGGCCGARRLRRRMLPMGLGMAALNLLCWAAVGVLWGGRISLPAAAGLLLPALTGGGLAGVLGAQLWRRG